MTWNKKNQQFALSCGLRPSTQEFAKCLNRMGDKYKAVEKTIDFREINRYLGKHRVKGEYDRKTVKEAIAQLELTHGWFVVVKSYTWAVHKVIIRPLNFALENKSQSGDKAPKLNRGNPMYSEDHKNKVYLQQQQDLSKLDTLLQKVGLVYTRDNLLKIWRMAGESWHEVRLALDYMLRSNVEQKEGVKKPHGWLIDSLTYGWHRLYYHHFHSIKELPSPDRLDGIMSLVLDCFPPPPTCQI